MRKPSTLVLFAFAAALLAGQAGAQYVEQTMTVGNLPVALAYDSTDQRVFVANNGSNSVSVIDPVNNLVAATLDIGFPPTDVAWNPVNNRVYVACAPSAGLGSVIVIDPTTGPSVVDTIEVGEEPVALAWHSGLNKLYCLNRTSKTLTVIDCPTGYVVTEIGLTGQIPSTMVYNPVNGLVYVTSSAWQQRGKVCIIDCPVDTVLKTLTANFVAWSMAVNPVRNRVFVANQGSNSLSVIDGVSNDIVAAVATGTEPTPVLWADINKIFIGEYWDNKVAYMHGDSTRIQGRVNVTSTPKSMIYAPTTSKVFCTSFLGGSVAVIDARDEHEHLITELSAGGGPLAMVYVPGEQRVFVGNSWENTVTVIKDVEGVEEARDPMLPGRGRSVRAAPNPVRPNGAVVLKAVGFSPDRLSVRDIAGNVAYSGAFGSWRPEVAGVFLCTVNDAQHEATCKVVVR